MEQYLMIGEILKPQGVKGEAKVKSYADCPEDYLRWRTLYFSEKGSFKPVWAVTSRVNDGFAYVTFDGCSCPEDVERLRGKQVYIDREHAAKLAEDTVYIADMIGITLIDESGKTLGTLTDVLQTGPVDVYVFSTPLGVMMAPALKAVFPVLDVEGRTMTSDSARLREVAVFED